MHFLFSTALLCSSQFMNSTEFLWSQIIALKSLKSPFAHYLPVDQHPNIQSSLASFLVYAAVPSYEPLDRELFYFVLLSHTLNAYSNAVLGLPDAQKTPHIAHMNFHLDSIYPASRHYWKNTSHLNLCPFVYIVPSVLSNSHSTSTLPCLLLKYFIFFHVFCKHHPSLFWHRILSS